MVGCYTMNPLLLFVVTVLASLTSSEANVYYVKPLNFNGFCPEPCNTLAYYIHNASDTFSSNTEIRFLAGIHNLEVNGMFWIQNVQNFSFVGNDTFIPGQIDLLVPSSQIECRGPTGFGFVNSTGLSISNLLFSQCGAIVGGLTAFRASIALGNLTEYSSLSDVELQHVVVQNSSGYGVLGYNMLGNSSITESAFIFSKNSSRYFGGNLRLFYSSCPEGNDSSFIRIESTKFLYGQNSLVQGDPNNTAAGLAISILGNSCTGMTIDILRITAVGNEGEFGGNAAIHYVSTVLNNFITVSDSYFASGRAQRGGGIAVLVETSYNAIDLDHIMNAHQVLIVRNSTFCSNRARLGGAMHLLFNEVVLDPVPRRKIVIEDCMIKNSASNGSAQAIRVLIHNDPGYVPTVTTHFIVEFVRCTITNSTKASESSSNPNAVSVSHLSNTMFTDCVFTNNDGSAILAVTSSLIFRGNITFRNNRGVNGGAFILCGQSLMYFQPDTRMYFVNNSAIQAGGAIFAENQCFNRGFCFFQVDVPYFSTLDNVTNIHLEFENNTAEYAGSAVYGGSIDFCFTIRGVDFNSTELFDHIFRLENTPSERSIISSIPIGVCFCIDNQPICDSKEMLLTVSPGELFVVSVTTVGQRNGTVPGVVHAEIITNEPNGGASIEDFQDSQVVSSSLHCANLTYTVHSPVSSIKVTLELTPEQPLPTTATDTNFNPPVLQIMLRDCPPGFNLSNINGRYQCNCDRILLDNNITCNITTGRISRLSTAWIGFFNGTGEGTQSGVLFHEFCPFDYCRATESGISLLDPDEQCAFSRSGILCGRCKTGLSLTLGSSDCHKCSDAYLTLLIVFILAGIALVAFLIAFDLTVTTATINGMIFYANIIWAQRSNYFPPGHTNVLTVFIAWINLDLGIKACFYDGMDAYARSWLQFIFPLYIWVIVAVIIILSNYFQRIAKLIGKNAVNVLATLFLLSYAKLQRTIITAFQHTFIDYPDGSRRHLWLHDATLTFLNGKQAILFTAALFFLLFLILPYVVVLLFVQLLRMITCFSRFEVRMKLKAFLDAYTGPYKRYYHFWTGFLLFIRTILFMIFAANNSGDPSLDLTFVTVTVVVILVLAWNMHGVYSKWQLDVLESTFLLNLVVLSVGTLYVLSGSGNQAALVYTSVGIVFATFLGILVFHAVRKYTPEKWSHRASEQKNEIIQSANHIWISLKQLHPTARNQSETDPGLPSETSRRPSQYDADLSQLPRPPPNPQLRHEPDDFSHYRESVLSDT